MHPLIPLLVLALSASGCASSQTVKSQDYAKLRTERTFEYPMPRIWKGVEEVLRKYRVVERDPEETPAPVDLSHLDEAVWETDWVYGRSRHKYVEYKVNGLPKKQYLQNRVKYEITAESVIGGTDVTVQAEEEIEELTPEGKSNGYVDATEPDTALANDFLEKLRTTLLAIPE